MIKTIYINACKKDFHYCKIAFFLYIMVPLFAIYSATFFRHEIDCEKSLILFRFIEGNKRVREGHAVLCLTRPANSVTRVVI